MLCICKRVLYTERCGGRNGGSARSFRARQARQWRGRGGVSGRAETGFLFLGVLGVVLSGVSKAGAAVGGSGSRCIRVEQ